MDEKIRDLLAGILQVPGAAITDDLTMKDVDAWDSLKHIELVVSLEEAFGLRLSFDEIASMRSVRQIEAVLKERGAY